jgi:peptidoglycan/LPS O-acetylase OafA/YrhL
MARRDRMLLLIILLLLLVLALPTWPYSAGWGYYPSGIFGLLLIVVLVVLLADRRGGLLRR